MISQAAKVLILKEVRRAVLVAVRALDIWIACLQGKDLPAGS